MNRNKFAIMTFFKKELLKLSNGNKSMIAYSIEKFNPSNEADDSFWNNFYNFYLKFRKENYPGDPVTPKTRLVTTLKDPHPHYHAYHWLVFTEGREIIAWADGYMSKKTHPAFETNNHIAHWDMVVLAQYHRKGIGSALLQKIIDNTKQHERTLIQVGSDQPSGHQFCKKYGGTEAIKGSENRLQITDVDWVMISEWIEDGKKKAPMVSLEMFNDVPDKDIEEYCVIYTETMNQQPMGEIEGRMRLTPESRRMDEERRKKSGCIWTTLISRESDGKISGLTEFFYYPDKPSILFQNLTGVKEEYRSRGLGKWLKAKMLKWIHSEYPEVKTIVTGNATTNAPMLSINNRIGFKEHKSEITYKFQTEELASYVS